MRVDQPEHVRAFETLFPGEGEMARLVREFDWSRTPLGPVETWPHSLRTSVGLMLGSQHPMWIGWGPANTFLYNDAYVSVLGQAKHPWALGRPAEEVWAEIWDICGPLADKVFQKGEASLVDDVRLFMRRGNDFLEETFYSFSYSPIRDESGRVFGLFCPSLESTAKNLNARRLATLSELAAKALTEKTAKAACATAAATLAKNFDDIPFALIYLVSDDNRRALLEQSTRLPANSPLAPPEIPLQTNGTPSHPWPVEQVVASLDPQVVSARTIQFPFRGVADQPLSEVMVLPLTSGAQERPVGVLVAGVNPARKLDAEHRTFFTLVAGQIATAIANARAAEEERARLEALAELNRAKTVFFSNVSHEFRTPLTLMLGPIEEMLGKPESQILPDNHKLASVAHRNGLRLLKLVNTLLDFSRLEAGKMQASFEPVELGAFTAELASSFRSMVEKAGLRLEVNCPPLREPVYVDRDLWEKIVFNLLSNAFKFTLEGGITVRVAAHGDETWVSVADTGTGIPPAELPNLFKRFYRIESSRGRTHEGTGIGLALVQELVKLHGGTIAVESQVNQGTTFTVRIPFGTAHLPAERIAAPRRQFSTALRPEAFVHEASRWFNEESLRHEIATADTKLPTAAEFAAAPGLDGQRPRILLADDNADMRDYVTRLLRERYEVTVAPDGKAALELAQSEPPDLILSDIMMPRLDGYGLLQAVRETDELKSTPVILLSARAGEEARVEGVSHGADDYLVKPFSARELLARVEAHLNLARLRREAEEKMRQANEQLSQHVREIGEAHQALRKSQERFDLVRNAAHVGFWFCDLPFDQLIWDNLVKEHFWLPPEAEVTIGTFYERLHPGDRERTRRAIERSLADRAFYDIEYRTVAPDGREKWIRAVGRGFYDPQGKPIRFDGITLDVTESRRAQEALRKSEERFRALVTTTSDAIYQMNADWSEMRHLEGKDFIADTEDPSRHWLHKYIHPDDQPRVLAIIEQAIRHKTIFESEHRVIRVDGTLGWAFSRAVPLLDEQGRILEWFGAATDITERKQAEERLERTVAERTAKLRETVAELEGFSYSIAHDMRAPLRAIQGYAKVLVEDYGGKMDAPAQTFLQRMMAAAYRMDRLIVDVLNYSKIVRAELPLEPVDVGKLLQGILESYPDFHSSKVDIQVTSPLPTVVGNEAALTQCLSNLIGNALKFVAPGAAPHVRIWCEHRGPNARLFVRDNGIGIPADQHEKIFGIFQRVETSYEGTGIGLAIVKKAMMRMGGQIGLESEPGRGSTFWIELRRA